MKQGFPGQIGKVFIFDLHNVFNLKIFNGELIVVCIFILVSEKPIL